MGIFRRGSLPGEFRGLRPLVAGDTGRWPGVPVGATAYVEMQNDAKGPFWTPDIPYADREGIRFEASGGQHRSLLPIMR